MLNRTAPPKAAALGSDLTTEKDKNLLLEKLLVEAMNVSSCDAGTLYVYEEGHLVFRIMKTLSQNVNLVGKDITLPPVELQEENVCAYSAIHRELINIPDVYHSDRFDYSGPKRYDSMTGYRTKSMLVFPLEDSAQKLIGVLQLINKLDDNGEIVSFTEDDEFSLRSLGSMTAVSLANVISSDLTNDSSKAFCAFFFAYCVWMLLQALWQYLGQPVSAGVMTYGVSLLGLLVFFYVRGRTNLSRKELGVKAEQPGKAMRTGLLVAVCAVAFLCVVKAVFRFVFPEAFGPEYPFIDFRAFGVRSIVFIVVAGIHQLLARSVIQSNLWRIMVGRNTADSAVVLSSMAFATMFIHMGFIFVLCMMLLACLEGILYEKQQSIYGVWVVHWIVGVAAILLHIVSV